MSSTGDVAASRSGSARPPSATVGGSASSGVRSGRLGWAAYVAASWSLLYGLLGLYWSFGGEGFPFGPVGDPLGARVSLLESARRDVAAPVIAALGLVGALSAMLMARSRMRGLPGAALLSVASAAAVTLTLVIPDYRPLMAVGRTPVFLVGRSLFDWPKGVEFFGPGMFDWPVLNQFLLIGGGLAWAATAVAYRRRGRGACGACGRNGDVLTGWATPAGAARWGRWAVAVAVAVPLLYALTRWAVALAIPLGYATEDIREEARESPGIWWAGAGLATFGAAGAVLTLGLVQRWGEVYPRWIPHLRGKPVRPRTAIVPASLVTVIVTEAGLMFNRALILGHNPDGGGKIIDLVLTAPSQLWTLWGLALGAATLAYYLRRRGRCGSCGHR
ncbi:MULTISPECIES: hypothetical protein [unclassified Spirillospora]|uniref:hypothetical protein n=1 Tax=unclassified Spirillospora TaxID=2642701 RepID=UPI0037205D86